MNILIVGSGGRENALAKCLSKSDKVDHIYLTGKNGGLNEKISCLDISYDDFDGLDKVIRNKGIELTIIGPEDPLNHGIVDELTKRGHRVFGPRKKAARLEGSKSFSKRFMEKYGIRTANYRKFDSYDKALANTGIYGYPEVIKADGLCAGKGVYICQDEGESKLALKEIFLDKIFKDQGSSVVIEKYLDGFEASLLCFVSGSKIYPFETAMDYKKIYEGDKGPNTGGVGCLSPNPYWSEDLDKKSDEILRRIKKGLQEEGLEYSGILFIGYMVVGGQPYVLEFNTRFGDPETEVLLPRLKSDLLENISQAMDRREVKLDWTDDVCMATILLSKGYPKKYETGYEISGLDQLEDALVFHNGTEIRDGKIYTSGGRVLSIVAKADNFDQARELVYKNIEKIQFENKSFRKDIGKLDK